MERDRVEPRRVRSLSVGCLLVGLALLAFARTGVAQIITVPPGLAPGSSYRLIFVTSAVRSGASGNVADYNAFVTSAATAVPALAALGTTWKAVAETSAVTAQDNTGTNPMIVGGTPTNPGVPFYRLDGLRVANDNLYFWNMLFPLAPISITELGSAAPITTRLPDGSTQPWVWTGITTGPSKLGSGFPVAAWATGGGANSWAGIAISASSNNHPLYAVSGVLRTPQAVPVSPAVAVSVLLGGLVLGAAALRARPPASRPRWGAEESSSLGG